MSHPFIPSDHQANLETRPLIDPRLLEINRVWTDQATHAAQTPVGLLEQYLFQEDIPVPYQEPSSTVASHQTSITLSGLNSQSSVGLPEPNSFPEDIPVPSHLPVFSAIVPLWQASNSIAGPSAPQPHTGPSKPVFVPGDIPIPFQLPTFTATSTSWQTSNAIAGPSRYSGALEPPTNLDSSVGPVRKRAKKKQEPVICDECGKTISNKSNLKTHIKSVHRKSNPRFYCHEEGCNKHYGDENGLRRHLWKVHHIPRPGR